MPQLQTLPTSPDPAQLVGPFLPPQDPELRAVVVSTITGSTTVHSTSGALGNSLDSALLNELRGWCDVVLVGAGTVKAENYAGVSTSAALRATRSQNGQSEIPPLAVLSSHLDLDVHSRFFTETSTAPLVLTENHDAEAAAALEEAGASVNVISDLSLTTAVCFLRSQGFHRILCEGGPSVFAQLVDANLVDVWHHTIDPRVSGAVELPIVTGGSEATRAMVLEAGFIDEESMLFLRYRRSH